MLYQIIEIRGGIWIEDVGQPNIIVSLPRFEAILVDSILLTTLKIAGGIREAFFSAEPLISM